MDRRRFVVRSLMALGAAPMVGGSPLFAPANARARTLPPVGAFADVERIAAAAARGPHRQERLAFSGPYATLDYDGLRKIRPRREHALWSGEERGFELDLLHSGFLFQDAIGMSLIRDGASTPIPFDPARFDYEDLPPPDPEGLTYSGLRLRYPINAPDRMDEVAVFQGASYFRSLGRNDFYGLSARGLALGVGAPEGEEFPYFSHFWVVEPEVGAESVTLFALLEGPSVAGAYAFEIAPGEETVMEVRASLFPRRDLETVGVAPLTSMFLFGPSDRIGVDDFRNAVHDSDGLQILTGAGERIWRPLANPRHLQVSAFLDDGPQGFGLQQRARAFYQYQDAEAAYERRTSLWIEPVGDWGPGSVFLVEIPSSTETDDNIVAFWRPAEPIPAGKGRRFAYRMRWGGRAGEPTGLARVVGTRSGLAPNDGKRRYVIDFETAGAAPPTDLTVSATTGMVAHPTLTPLSGTLIRAAFAFTPQGEETSELRLQLQRDGAVSSETWLYRWTPA